VRETRGWRGAYKGAFLKDQKAKRKGKSRYSNPYKANMYDIGTGNVTWGVGFWRAWNNGFDSTKTLREG